MTNNTLRVCSTCQVRKKFCLLLNLLLTPHPRSANDQRPTISYLKSCYWVFWCFLDLTDVTLADWRHTYFILLLFNILLRLDQGKRPGARGLMMAGPPGAYMHIWTLDTGHYYKQSPLPGCPPSNSNTTPPPIQGTRAKQELASFGWKLGFQVWIKTLPEAQQTQAIEFEIWIILSSPIWSSFLEILFKTVFNVGEGGGSRFKMRRGQMFEIQSKCFLQVSKPWTGIRNQVFPWGRQSSSKIRDFSSYSYVTK